MEGRGSWESGSEGHGDERRSVAYRNPRKTPCWWRRTHMDAGRRGDSRAPRRRNVAAWRMVDISIVVVDERPSVVDDHGEEANGNEADGRVCLACGHLLPSTPGGWPCPSVFGERLSPLRRQTVRLAERRRERDVFPSCPQDQPAGIPGCRRILVSAFFSLRLTEVSKRWTVCVRERIRDRDQFHGNEISRAF